MAKVFLLKKKKIDFYLYGKNNCLLRWRNTVAIFRVGCTRIYVYCSKYTIAVYKDLS